MSSLTQNESRSGQESVPSETPPSHRRRPLRVLFIHTEASTVSQCLQELEKGQYTVSSEIVSDLAKCESQLHTQAWDVVVLEYPTPRPDGSHVTQLLHRIAEVIPVIALTAGSGGQFISELTAQGAFDYVEREHIAKLPMAVRRALKEKKLREELEEARKALQFSQSRYRALVDNPAYGICQSDAEGRMLDANQALVTMLGYASKEELLAASETSPVIPCRGDGLPIFQGSAVTNQIEPVEIDWKRRDGTVLKTRLSGRGVFDDRGNFAGYEIIAVDITEQRTLEDQLRHQASTDSLTGLANHRRLFDALQAEISRSKRTEREFSVLLLDLDGLKEINDQFGHLAGNRALCRLSQILIDCCRSVDTAARHGGDEFAVVLPETGLTEGMVVARRICDLLAKESEEPALSVSVGVASYPREADTIASLLYAADRALYAMKSSRAYDVRASR